MKLPTQPARIVLVYAVAAVVVLGIWFNHEVHAPGFTWSVLITVAALTSLWDTAWPVALVVLTHWLGTGELEAPVIPGAAEPERPPQPAPLPPQPPPATGSSAVTSYTPSPFPPGTSVTGSVTGVP